MNVRMVDVALEAMREVDVLCLVVDVVREAGPGDRYLLTLLKDVKTPAILALNKVDLDRQAELLPIIDHYQRSTRSWKSCRSRRPTEPTSTCWRAVPAVPAGRGAALSADYVTDQPERFFIGEIVREQVLQLTHDELPFSTAVIVDRIEPAERPVHEHLLHDSRRSRIAEADSSSAGRAR
jgi:GTP-binding protein Era